ncbi:MAG TPA: hypothetical protein VMZ53_15195 [Kofleriaceae bacterium]|nr:hypothetical protein [Kofleriaceae bacterium]
MRLAIGVVLILGACGGDDGGAQKDAAVDSKAIDAPIDGKTFLDAPAGTTALTIKNELAWCEISVMGGTASTASTITTNVTPGSITLVAKAAPGAGSAPSAFKIAPNMWHHTTNDTGTGETGTVAGTGDAATSTVMALVVSGTPKCVWVCCPFKNGTGCGTTDLCP